MSIAQKSVENFLARIAAQAFSIAGAIVIARVLGPSGKGMFSYAGSLLAMIQMANAGQAAAISWQYAKRNRAPSRLVAAMVRVLAYITIPASIALAVCGFVIPGQGALIAVAAALPFALFAQSATGFFLADSNVRMLNVQQLIIGVLPVLVYAPLLIFAHTSIAILFGLWVAGFIGGAAYSALVLQRYRSKREGEESDSLVKEQLTYGSQISLNSAVQFLNFRIDVFIIMFMLGQTALGVYSIGIGIGELLWQLSRPMATAAFGVIARGTESQAADATATCMRHSFALVLIGAVVVFFLAPPLVPLVYGHQFAAAGMVSRALLPGIMAYSMMPTLATFFAQQLGRPRIPLIFSTVSTVLCGGLTVVLLPHFGIVGGAVATSCSYVIAFTAAAAYFVHRTHIAPLRLFKFTRSDLRPYRLLLSQTLGALRG